MKIVQDVNKSIMVMNAGSWMEKTGLNPSKWWKPENMNPDFMLKHTEPDEFYVALINNKPAASTERNQSWKSIDDDKPKKALYLHWLCVHRDFAKQGLPKIMLEFAKKQAKKIGFTLLRLDTIFDNKKLCSIYEILGFRLMGKEDSEKHTTAFYQMSV